MNTYRIMTQDECGTEKCLENYVQEQDLESRMAHHGAELNEEMRGLWYESEGMWDNEVDDGYDYDRYY